MIEEKVTISKQCYDRLLDDSAKLNSLLNGGVDNWEWYWEALQEYRDWKGEDENS